VRHHKQHRYYLISHINPNQLHKNNPDDNPESVPEPIAQVQTTKLQKSGISETLTVYGTVLPWPDKLQSISVPYNSVVKEILVNEGQQVQQGDLLLTLNPSNDAKLQLEQAHKELEAAKNQQQLVQERIRLKLATQPELVSAQLRTDQAKTMLDNLTGRGIAGYQQLKAGKLVLSMWSVSNKAKPYRQVSHCYSWLGKTSGPCVWCGAGRFRPPAHRPAQRQPAAGPARFLWRPHL